MKALVLNRVALILACAGMYVSGVLSIGALFSISVPCGGSHGCDTVAQHPSSHMLGVPNSYIGFLLYAVLAGLALWRLMAPGVRLPVVAAFFLTGLGTLFSLYLTYIAITVIGATCMWCLTSTGLMVVLFFVHALLWGAERTVRDHSIVADAGLTIALLAAMSVALTVQTQAMIADSTKGAGIMEGLKNSEVLPEGAHAVGSPDAKLAIVEFGDLLCPQCKLEFPILREYVGVHPGKVKYVFRHFPMYQMHGHEQSAAAAVASEIAAEKGRFWNFLEGMYSKDREQFQTVDGVLEIAKNVGLDPQETLKRIQNTEDPAFKRMMRDLDDASKFGVGQTPTFFIVAPGLKVRAATADTLFNDLKRPEYGKFLNGP